MQGEDDQTIDDDFVIVTDPLLCPFDSMKLDDGAPLEEVGDPVICLSVEAADVDL